MTRNKTPAQLQADIDQVLAKKPKKKKAQSVEDRRADYATAERQRVKRVRDMMVDLTGDDDWETVDLDQLASWLDLGSSWNPTSYTTRELAEQLLEQSVEPQHAGAKAAEDSDD